MKLSHLLTALHCSMALALSAALTSCPDRALEPECQTPTSLGSIKAGSYWIYERTLLDSSGNPVASGKTTFDSLVYLGRDASHSYQNTSALLFEDYHSEDGGVTTTKDTVYWVITPEVLYVQNNPAIQQNNCTDCALKLWREYENCTSVHRTIADITVPGGTLPTLVPDGKGGNKVIQVTTQFQITNKLDMIGSATLSVNGNNVVTKKSVSLLHQIFMLVTPSDVVFSGNGKRSVTLHDERTVWINGDIGLVKEKALLSDDSNNPDRKIMNSFERTLVRYNIQR